MPMSIIHRVARNTFAMFLSNILSLILGFAYAAYSARYLGPDRYGIIGTALALTSLFGFFLDLGLGQLMVREVARNKSLALKYAGNIAAIKLLLTGLTFGIIVLTVNLLDYPDATKHVVYIITLSIIINTFSSLINSLFQALEKIVYISVYTALNSALMLAGAYVAIREGWSVIGFAFIYLSASVICFAYSLSMLSWKFFRPTLKADIKFWRPALQEASSFGLTALFVSIYYWLAPVMLSSMKGNEAVGWYNAAFRLFLILLILPSILNMSLYPLMSRFYVTAVDSLRLAYEKYFKYMAILAIPIAIGTTLLADRIIDLIFGKAFSNSAIALRILVWSSVFIFLGNAPNRLLEASNKQFTLTKITGICAAMNVILNLALIPRYSFVGTSFSSLITELVAMLLGYISCVKLGHSLTSGAIYGIIKIIIASFLMGLFIILLRDLNLLVLISLSALFYFIMLYLLGGFDTKDIEMLKDLLNFILCRKKADQPAEGIARDPR